MSNTLADKKEVLVRLFEGGKEITRMFFDSIKEAIDEAIAWVNEGEEGEREAEVLEGGRVVRQFSANSMNYDDEQLSRLEREVVREALAEDIS